MHNQTYFLFSFFLFFSQEGQRGRCSMIINSRHNKKGSINHRHGKDDVKHWWNHAHYITIAKWKVQLIIKKLKSNSSCSVLFHLHIISAFFDVFSSIHSCDFEDRMKNFRYKSDMLVITSRIRLKRKTRQEAVL